MSKWKKILNKQNSRHYAWPAGWDPAEVIAEQLECSPERVREHLAPSIKSGDVEVKHFTIWDGETGRKVVKTGFRIVGAHCQTQTVKSASFPSKPTHRHDRWPFSEGAKIMRPDNPKRIGTVKGSRIHWNDGRVTTPESSSQRHKLRLAK